MFHTVPVAVPGVTDDAKLRVLFAHSLDGAPDAETRRWVGVMEATMRPTWRYAEREAQVAHVE